MIYIIAAIIAVFVISFLFMLRVNFDDWIKKDDKYKTTGNGAQVISAFGALLFGISSVGVAISVNSLQEQSRKDAEVGRISDLLIKSEENKNKNYDDYVRSGGCISFVKQIIDAKGEKYFNEHLMNDDDQRAKTHFVFSDRIIDESVGADQLYECLTPSFESESAVPSQVSAKRFYLFYKRFIFGLNYFESVLFNWDRYNNTDSKHEISEEVVEQVCKGPIRKLFETAKHGTKLGSLLEGAYPNLIIYTKDCKNQLADVKK